MFFSLSDYENHREEEAHKYNEALKLTLDSLKPLIYHNLEYLRYAQAKKWFKMTPDEEEQTATHNALVTIIGRATSFSVEQARKLAFEVLQEVNDHDNAQKVAELLGLKLKPHEVE